MFLSLVLMSRLPGGYNRSNNNASRDRCHYPSRIKGMGEKHAVALANWSVAYTLRNRKSHDQLSMLLGEKMT
jgi:hypothetical protein